MNNFIKIIYFKYIKIVFLSTSRIKMFIISNNFTKIGNKIKFYCTKRVKEKIKKNWNE